MNAKKHSFVNLTRAFSAHISSTAHCFLRLKKGEMMFLFGIFYGRFLSIPSITKARTMMIRTIMPAIAGAKYWSATDVGVAVGATVVVGDATTAPVSPDEP
jgi:hypothetical protein